MGENTNEPCTHLGTGGIELGASQLRCKVECDDFVSDKVLSGGQVGGDRHVCRATIHYVFRISTVVIRQTIADVQGRHGRSGISK